MRLLIAIESCHADRNRHQAQRDTWLRDLSMIEHKFFLGHREGVHTMQLNPYEPDEVALDVDDSYQALSLKTRAICRWAADRDYDYIFKTDTDTVICPVNFLSSGFQNHDYMGGSNADIVPAFSDEIIQFASGGAGYWLSRKALTTVANAASVETSAEDVFVAATLKARGISPVWHSGYRWRPGESIDKDVVSLHLSSALQQKYAPCMMYEYYEKIKQAAL